MKDKGVKEAINELEKCKSTPVLKKIISLLQQLKSKNKCLPKEYLLLFSELGKCTPIKVLFPSHNDL